jgi:hypothetical protein
MKKSILIIAGLAILLSVISVSLNSCASSCQRIKANGSIIGSTNGDWIVIKQSGGRITDVYLLESVMVQSEQGSDGWLFLDQDGNPTHIGGDMKAIRVSGNKQRLFSKYHEYHMEFEVKTYGELYGELGSKQ